MADPTQIEIIEFLSRVSFDTATGIFVWERPPHHSGKRGDVAGHVHPNGYRYIKVNHKRYMAHRLAFFAANGRWPRGDIDHINGVKDDNRPANLRECNDSENRQNIGITKANTSGYPGVIWHKRNRKFVARITHQGVFRWLGQFDNPQDAYAAYRKAKSELHTFAPLGRGLPPIPVIGESDAPVRKKQTRAIQQKRDDDVRER